MGRRKTGDSGGNTWEDGRDWVIRPPKAHLQAYGESLSAQESGKDRMFWNIPGCSGRNHHGGSSGKRVGLLIFVAKENSLQREGMMNVALCLYLRWCVLSHIPGEGSNITLGASFLIRTPE